MSDQNAHVPESGIRALQAPDGSVAPNAVPPPQAANDIEELAYTEEERSQQRVDREAAERAGRERLTAIRAKLAAMPPLSAAHADVAKPPLPLEQPELANLRASGLTDETIRKAQIATIGREEIKTALGWGRHTEQPPLISPVDPRHTDRSSGDDCLPLVGMGIPLILPGTDHACAYRVRLRHPRPQAEEKRAQSAYTYKRDEHGRLKAIKYESPKAILLEKHSLPAQLVYFGPLTRASGALRDTSRTLFFTEGEKKALALEQCGLVVVGLTGIWNWGDGARRREHKTEHPSAKRHFLHPHIEQHVELRDRAVVICFDYHANKPDPAEPKAADELAHRLYQAGAREVRFCWPPTEATKGCDDLYVAGGLAAHVATDARQLDLTRDCSETLDHEAARVAVMAMIEAAEPVKRRTSGRVQPLDEAEHASSGESGSQTGSLDEVKISDRFVAEHGADFRFCAALGGWHVWTGTHWALDTREVVRERAKDVARSIASEAAASFNPERLRAARAANKASGVAATLTLARSSPRVVFSIDDADADPWLLNARNGTIDLRTGALRPHQRDDLITRIVDVDYDPNAQAPTFERFLADVQPDADDRAYLARLFGYAAVGVVREHVLAVLWGAGANGKSVFADVVTHALGAYARPGADSLITRQGNHEPHPTDVASCAGSRLVLVHETRDGAQFDASKVKKLTGGDKLTAHFMHRDFFDFRPTHTLVMLTNHKPRADAADAALWRRVHLVPWDVVIPAEQRDVTLAERIKVEESSGVLAWIVRGAIDWAQRGLVPPDRIVQQTAAYREAEDAIGQFVTECCVRVSRARERSNSLYEAYRQWCEATGNRPRRTNDFADGLQRLGFERVRGRRGTEYVGLGLITEREAETSEGQHSPDADDFRN